MCQQLLPHLYKQLRDGEPFVWLHLQRACEEIGEELVAVYLAFQFGAVQQFGRPKQHPSAQRDTLAVVLQAAYLSRLYGNNRAVAHLQRLHAVGEDVRKLPLNEQSIHPIIVHAMTERRQFVIVYDAQQRVQHGGIHKPGIIVGAVNPQDIGLRSGLSALCVTVASLIMFALSGITHSF